MSEILFINACVRENSRTLELANLVLDKLGNKHDEVSLYEVKLAPLDMEGMKKRDVAFSAKDFSDSSFALARQFSEAETIVIAAPYWDLMFPAVLKLYFESICVSGLTFVYGENGRPKGLCKAKRLIYVTTSGGPIINNFGYDYTCALAKSFFEIKELKLVSAQGLDIYGANVDAIMQRARDFISFDLLIIVSISEFKDLNPSMLIRARIASGLFRSL